MMLILKIKNSNNVIHLCQMILSECGNSGSGKTNLLYHMLIEPLLHYDEIHLYAKNLEQEKYQNLMKKMNEISREVDYHIMTVSNDKIIPIRDLGYEDNQKIIIFDDYVCEKNQR